MIPGVRLVVVLLMLLVAAPTASAQTGRKPPTFRHNDGARDLREGAGPDRWTITVLDPRTGDNLLVHAGSGESTVDVRLQREQRSTHGAERQTVPAGRAGFRRVAYPGPNQNAGHVDLRRVRGGWRLTARSAFAYELDLTIRSRGPGPTLVSRYPEGHGLLRRAMPVMDGVATGSMREGDPLGPAIRMDGWRVTVVHDWWVPSSGCCATGLDPVWPYPRCCSDTDVAMVHGARGATGVIGGWTSTAPANGSDSVDRGAWSGVVATRRGGRLTWCRARRPRIVHRRGEGHTLVGESMTITSCRPTIRIREIPGEYERFEAFAGGRRTRHALWMHQEASSTGTEE